MPDYNALVERFGAAAGTRAALADGAPDDAGKALTLSAETGVPAPLIQLDTADFEQRRRAQETQKLLAEDTVLQEYINSNPLHAQASADDWAPLAALSKTWKSATAGYRAGFEQERFGLLTAQEQFSAVPRERLDDARREMERLSKPLPWPYRLPQVAGQAVGGMMFDFMAGGASGATLGAKSGGATGAAAGAALGTGVAGGLSGYGQALDMLGQLEAAQGETIAEPVKQIAAIGIGLTIFAANSIGMRPQVTAGLQSIVNDAAIKAATTKTVTGAVGRGAARLGKAGLTGSALFGAMEFLNQTITDVAKTVSEGDWETIFNDPKRRAEVVGRVYSAMVEGAAAITAFHIPGVGGNVVTDVMHVRQARADAKLHEQMMGAAEESATRKRSPEAFRAFAEKVVRGRTVSVPAEKIVELGMEDDLRPLAKDFDTQLETGLASGGDVTFGYADWLAKVDPEADRALRQDLRQRPEGLTETEVKENIYQAAVEVEGQVFTGPAHTVALEKAAGALGLDHAKLLDEMGLVEATAKDGFVTSEGRFVDRQEAARIDEAFQASKQIATSTASELYLKPLFADAASAGMTKPQFARYSARLEEWANGVNEKALASARREVSRRQTATWTDAAADIRRQVESVIHNERPDFGAFEFLARGKFLGDAVRVPDEARVKLSANAVRDITDKPLPKGTTARNGIDPDEVATLLGFRSGRDLVEALAALEAERGGRSVTGVRKDAVEAEVDRQMTERFGALDEAIEREARETALTRVQEDLLTDELNAIGQSQGAPPFQIEALRGWARDKMGEMPMNRALRLTGFTRMVGKAGREAEMALLKGQPDYARAFAAKQKQLIAHLMAQEANKLDKEFRSAAKRFKRLGKKPARPNIDQTYMDQIHRLLRLHDVGVRRNRAELDQALANASLKDFVESKLAEGRELLVSPELMSDIVAPLDTGSVDRFRALVDAIKTLEHHGKEEKTVTLAGEKLDRETLIGQIVQNLDKLPRRFQRTRGWKNAARKAVFSADNLLVRMNEIIDDLDRNDPTGPMNQVFRGLVEAQQRENDFFVTAGARLRDIKGPGKRPDTLVNQTLFVDPLTNRPMELSRWDMIHVAANLGNRGNLDRLIKGYFPETVKDRGAFESREAQVRELVNRTLMPEDWQWVQGIWDFFKWMKPQIDEKARRTTGVAPDPVEAVAVATPHGTFSGGYYPIFYDPTRSNQGLRVEKALFEAEYAPSTPTKSYMHRRAVGFSDTMHIQQVGERLPGKIKEMIHDISFHEAIVDARKILYDSRVRQAINRSLGPEYAEQIDPFMKYIANKHNSFDKGTRWLDDFLHKTRSNLAVTVLGLNLKVILTPNLGNMTNILKRMGTRPMDTLNHTIAHWPENYRLAMEKSGELRNWERDFNRDVSELYSQTFHMKSISAGAARVGLALPVKIEKTLATLDWLTTYREQIGKGVDEADAIFLADKNIRRNFGRAGSIDLPPIMRSNEATRLLTLFYGFGNLMYNRTRRIVKLTRQGGREVREGDWAGARRDFAQALSDSLWFVLVPAIFGAVYQPPTEDDTWGTMAGKLLGGQLAQTLPLGRELANKIIYGYDPRPSPAVSIMQSIWGTGKDVASIIGLREEDPSEEALKNAVSTIGLVFGLPTGQVGTTGQFIWDWNQGEQQVNDIGDIIRGVIYGESERR